MLSNFLWVSRYIRNNTHRPTVTLRPDPELAKKGDEAEQARTAAATSNFAEKYFKNITAETQRPKAQQAAHDRPADLAKIPNLTSGDLETGLDGAV